MWRALAIGIALTSGALAAVVDISTAQLEALPKAPTEVQVHAGRVSKPTAGDLVELRVKPPQDIAASAQISVADELTKGPVQWGEGRILWWKPLDAQSGEIVVGLTTYTPGPFEIPAIPFVSEGKPIFASQPKTVTFTQIGGDKSKDDIYPPMAVSIPMWVWILFGLLALAIVLGGIYWLARWSQGRKKALEELARAPRLLNPIEEFEKTRHETDQKSYLEKAAYKPHYFALSDAAKRFLGKSYRFDAEERTTRELMRELESLGVPDDLIDRWEQVFEEMDVTKFTDQQPLHESARSLSSRLSQLASETYRQSPVAREALQVSQAAAKGGKS